MANKKISELEEKTLLDGTEYAVIAEAQTNKKVKLSLLKGAKGDTGAQGEQGPQGPAGADGTNGADGADGKTPVLETGDTTTLAAGSEDTAEVVANGTDTGGNPKYKLNFGIPKGADGSGSGNVYVNPAGLLAAKKYAFKPQADNSATGSFVEVEATGGGGAVDITDILTNGDGSTISVENYNKLKGLIETGTPMYAVQGNSLYSIVGTMQESILYLHLLSPYGQSGFLFVQYHIGSDCSVTGYSGIVPSSDYVAQGMMTGYSKPSAYSAISNSDSINRAIGKLEAGLNALQEGGGTAGSGVYYIPKEVYSLKSGATEVEIKEAFGGDEGIESLKNAIRSGKQIFIDPQNNSVSGFYTPVTALNLISSFNISFRYLFAEEYDVYILIGGVSPYVKQIYPSGYALDSSVVNLSSSSSSSDISNAVGGESGMKKIVYAIKDGNQINVESQGIRFLALMTGSKDTDTEMGFVFSYGDTLGAKYNKSTQTFTFITDLADIEDGSGGDDETDDPLS